jgi:hypothetical protein
VCCSYRETVINTVSESVDMIRRVKTQLAKKGSAGAVVICSVETSGDAVTACNCELCQ